MPSDAWKLLNDVRKFIEVEYANPSAEPDGEWLAKEARHIHNRVCTALANYSTSLPADAAEAVADLRRAANEYPIRLTELRGKIERSASLIQSQAARIAEASWELEAALLSADPYPYVRNAARALLNRRAEG